MTNQIFPLHLLLFYGFADGTEPQIETSDIKSCFGPAHVPEPVGVVKPTALIEGADMRGILPRAPGKIVRNRDLEQAADSQQIQASRHRRRQVADVLEHVVGDNFIEIVVLEGDFSEASRRDLVPDWGRQIEVQHRVGLPIAVHVDIEIVLTPILATAKVHLSWYADRRRGCYNGGRLL